MQRFRPHRPSPAMVVALLALFVAMGGAGYAAFKLPKNSVGTKQIKPSAVNSSKVRDGSLLAQDFRAGQLPAGPAGPAGLQGPQGQQGPTGAQGDPATSLFAYVNYDGFVVYGKGVVGATLDTSGDVYTVTFDRSLEKCVLTGNVGIGNPGTLSGHFIQTVTAVVSATLDKDHPTQVSLVARQPNGTALQTNFFLTVFC
ncbi:MAG: hypothetical protein QOJ12_1505 [Thermoleophilales bacterium]|jgi:hypothetical protein|nr:hypothetical protein [Thermoleophilales bacterium]